MIGNIEEKENLPERESQNATDADLKPEIEMDIGKETDQKTTRIAKRKIQTDSVDENSFNYPMVENVNALNKSECELDEPLVKKKFEKHNLGESYRPFYSVFSQNFLLSIEAISLIYKTEDELQQNWEIAKLKSSGRLKRQNAVINSEATIVKIQPKNTNNLNNKIESRSNYYIGDQTIRMFNIGPKLDLIDLESENFKFYVYESVYEFKSAPEEFGTNGIRTSDKKLIEMEDREHFLIISNFDHDICEETNFFLKFEKTQLTNTILRLTGSNYIKILLKKLECLNNSINISLKIYLTVNCSDVNLIESNPSFNCSNSKIATDINFVMSYFFPTLNSNSALTLLYQKNISDELVESKHHDESEIKNRNENLFDLIYELHKENGSLNEVIGCGDDSVIQELSYLRPALRPYQINGIKWMLFKENFTFDQLKNNRSTQEIHPLYIKLVNGKNDFVYYHKFYGIATKNMPLKLISLPGGILADEMGLGKTLEILSLIMLNQRNDDLKFEFYKCQIDKNKQELNKKSFSCLCGNTPESFQADSFKRHKQHLKEQTIYQCVACLVWTHVNCVNYKGSKEEFLCLECCTKVPPIKSGCTLIVTPSVISYQWAEEIRKHLNKKLNVLVYKGTASGFVQPRDLATLDICITTYDVLSNELAHVFAIENQRSLRKAKRFSNIPSPLIYVEWWRVCLDEAQMVHSTNSRCAEMANRLHAVNRWCVTGTPIGRSLADLHGLFTFIREDPYINKKWFKYCLFEPFQMGDKMPMAKAVSNVMWRTSKRFVENQINIPKQTEVCYWIDFSPFEAHLYQRVLEIFRDSRKNSFKGIEANNQTVQTTVQTTSDESQNIDGFFSKYLHSNMRFDEIDRSVIDHVDFFLLNLIVK